MTESWHGWRRNGGLPEGRCNRECQADMEMSPTGSELMEEQLDKINRLGEEISVEFLPVDE